jgi:hypothetical protein
MFQFLFLTKSSNDKDMFRIENRTPSGAVKMIMLKKLCTQWLEII